MHEKLPAKENPASLSNSAGLQGSYTTEKENHGSLPPLCVENPGFPAMLPS